MAFYLVSKVISQDITFVSVFCFTTCGSKSVVELVINCKLLVWFWFYDTQFKTVLSETQRG